MSARRHLSLKDCIDSKIFERGIIILIILNSITLGMETFTSSRSQVLITFNTICTIIFTIEIVLKILVHKKDIFRDGWDVFDIIVVGLSLVPEMTFFSAVRTMRVLRSFRVLRTIRLVPHVRELQNIIRAIITALPGIGWTVCLLFIVYYIYAVVGTNLFSSISAEYFGDLWKTLYTLFQLTMADDVGNITRPIIEQSKVSVVYFISCAIIAVLIVLKMIIGIIVDSVEETRKQNEKEQIREQDVYLLVEQMEEQLQELKKLLSNYNRTGE